MFFKQKKLIRFVYSTMLLCIVFFVFISTLYLVFVNAYNKNTYVLQQENLKQISDKYLFSVSNIRGVAHQILNDPERYDYLNEANSPLREYYYNRKLKQQLAVSEHLETIYVLLGDAVNIATVGTAKINRDNVEDAFAKCQFASAPILREITYIDNSGQEKTEYVYTYAYSKNATTEGKLKDAVLLEFSTEWANSFSDSVLYDLAVFDKNANVVLSTNRDMSITDLQDLHSSLKQDFGRVHISALKEKDRIYSVYNTNDLQFVSLLKPDVAFQNFFDVFKGILGVCGVIFLLMAGFVLYFNKFAKFILAKKNADAAKVDFYLECFNAKQSVSEKEVKKMMKDTHISINLMHPVRVILLKVSEGSVRDVQKNQKLVMSALEAWADSHVERFLLDSTHYIMITNEMDCAEITNTVRDILKDLKYNYGIDGFAFVSEKGELLANGSVLYDQVFWLSNHTFLLEKGCVVVYEEFHFEPGPYPFQQYRSIEDKIKKLVTNGAYQEAKACYLEAAQKCKDGFYSNAEVILKNLLQTFMQELYPKNTFVDVLFEKVYEINNIEDVFAFANTLEEYFPVCREERGKQHHLVKMADDYIKLNYHSYDLSVAKVAEALSLSSGYLGQLYKKNKNCTINETINLVRLHAIKEMIETTNRPVMDIAAEAGILSKSQLYKLFKNYYGVTPNSLRHDKHQ